MKRLKSFYTLILCMILTAVMSLSGLFYCANSTLMSSRHSAMLLAKEATKSRLTALLYSGLLQQPEDSRAGSYDIILDALERTDQDWLHGQLSIAVGGVQSYLSGDAASLPMLYIAPLNQAVKQVVLEKAMHQPQAQDNIKRVETVLSALNNKYLNAVIGFGLNSQLSTAVMNLAPIRDTGFDRTALSKILNIYLSFNNRNISMEQASRSIVQQMTSEVLELDKPKDYLDLNLFMDKAFGKEQPLADMKVFIASMDTSLSILSFTILVCILILLWLNYSLKLTVLLKSVCLCTAAGSCINILLSVLLFVPAFAGMLADSALMPKGAFSQFIAGVLALILKDFGIYLALQAAVWAVFSLALLMLLKRVSSGSKIKKAIRIFPSMRLAAMVLVIALLSVWWDTAAIHKNYDAFRSRMEKYREVDMTPRIIQGLIEAGDMDYLKHLQKK